MAKPLKGDVDSIPSSPKSLKCCGSELTNLFASLDVRNDNKTMLRRLAHRDEAILLGRVTRGRNHLHRRASASPKTVDASSSLTLGFLGVVLGLLPAHSNFTR